MPTSCMGGVQVWRRTNVERKPAGVQVPLVIEPPVLEVPKSERVAKERQQPLFKELADTKLPQVDLLDAAPLRQEGVPAESLEMTSRLIEKKLRDFGVEVHVVAASPGPVITRYEIEPAVGVKGSQIVNLVKDLARALSVVSIRVVETIPGKSCMGLEIPNPNRQTVRLTEILGSKAYHDLHAPLALAPDELQVDLAQTTVVFKMHGTIDERAGGAERFLHHALSLAERMVTDFQADDGGFYSTAHDHEAPRGEVEAVHEPEPALDAERQRRLVEERDGGVYCKGIDDG